MGQKANVSSAFARVPLVVRTIPMVAVMAVIFSLSHQPAERLDIPDIPFVDKVGHFLLYTLLALAVLLVPSRDLRLKQPKAVAGLTFLLCLLYGIGDEFHQSFIPGRHAGSADVVADACGAAFVCFFWLLTRAASQKKYSADE
ncbi:MAG: VanZ family protein [Desulfopila sp.]|jgi:VanZ family protein|nr:VanZ family protein [Desulfopila sp.]